MDAWREDQSDDPSRSEAIRRLVEQGLDRTARKAFEVSNSEKLVTWLLTEILKSQKCYSRAKDMDFIQEVITGGHYWA